MTTSADRAPAGVKLIDDCDQWFEWAREDFIEQDNNLRWRCNGCTLWAFGWFNKKTGYWSLKWRGKWWSLHRIQFLYFHGYLPHGGKPTDGIAPARVVHHINGLRYDCNRYNLDDVTRDFNSHYIPHKHYKVYNPKTESHAPIEVTKTGRRKRSSEYRDNMRVAQNRREVRVLKSKKIKEKYEDPEFKKKMLEAHRDPCFIKLQSKNQKRVWECPEYRAKALEKHNSLEYTERQSKMQKALWQDPEHVKKMMVIMQDPEIRKKKIEGLRESFKRRRRELINEMERQGQTSLFPIE